MEFKEIEKLLNYAYREDRYPPSLVYNYLDKELVMAEWRNAIVDNDDMRSLKQGLYIHFPFCPKKCSFCYCNSVECTDSKTIKEYLKSIVREISQYPKLEFNTLYFGGGTPSFMTAKQIDALFKYLFKIFKFTGDVQIQFDCSPMTLSDEKIECLERNGVNRITIGVQSFNSDVLKMNNRINSYDSVKRLIRKTERFAKINIDLIAGLKGQTKDIFFDDISKAVELRPAMIHLYPLTATSATEFDNVDESTEWIESGQELLIDAGYRQIKDDGFGIDESARNVQETDVIRYNSNLLGIGNGAQSHIFGRLNYVNVGDLKTYMDRMQSGQSIYRGIEMDRAREMIWYVLHNTSIDKKIFKELFGEEIDSVFPHIPMDKKERAELFYQKEIMDIIVQSRNHQLSDDQDQTS